MNDEQELPPPGDEPFVTDYSDPVKVLERELAEARREIQRLNDLNVATKDANLVIELAEALAEIDRLRAELAA